MPHSVRKDYDLAGAEKALVDIDDTDFGGIEQPGTGVDYQFGLQADPDEVTRPVPDEQPEDKEDEDEELTQADELAAMRTEMKAYQDWQAQELDRIRKAQEHSQHFARQQREQYEDPIPTRYLTDLDLAGIHQMSQRVQMLEERAGKAIESAKRSEMAAFQRAEAAMREKYPDLDDFVPARNRELAIKTVLEQEAFGVDWESELGRVYRDKAFDKHNAKRDELSQKRQEKQREATKVASKVVSGGSPYQEPELKKPLRDTRYHSAKDRAMAAFNAIGGGG